MQLKVHKWVLHDFIIKSDVTQIPKTRVLEIASQLLKFTVLNLIDDPTNYYCKHNYIIDKNDGEYDIETRFGT